MQLRRYQDHPLARWWWTVDHWLLFAYLSIIGIGLILVAAGSPAVAERIGLDSYHFINRHYVFTAMSIMTMLGVSMLPIKMISRLAVLGVLGSLILMALLPFIGTENKGATRWIVMAGFSLQPSEFLKPCLAVAAAWLLSLRQSLPGFPSIRAAFILYAITLALLIIQPDFGMTVVVSAVAGIQLFAAGMPWPWIIVLLILAVIGGYLAYSLLPHVQSRIDRFFDPTQGDNYQINRSLEAIQEGGLLGQGVGEGSVKEVLPDAHTDFIFAVAAEEFGLWFSLLIVLLYGFIFVRCVWRLLEQEHFFVVLAGLGLTSIIGLQAVVNMGVASGLLPAKGMTLPMISYGGSSMLATSITAGMILALLRRRFGQIHRQDVRRFDR